MLTARTRCAPWRSLWCVAFWLFLTVAISAAAAPEPSAQLPPPQWVGAADRGGKAVLAWIRDQRFARVRVYRSSPETKGAFVLLAEVRENSYTDAAVAPGGTYRYRLAAVGADGREGRPSLELNVLIAAVTLKPPRPPAWEGYLALETGVGLKWGDQEGADVIAYNVYRKAPPETEFQLVASVRGTSFSDTGLDPGRLYVYALTALDSSFRETPYSEELPVKHQPRAAPEAAAKPGAPTWRMRRTRLVTVLSGGDQPFFRPADVVVGPVTGNVYLTDSGRNRVFVFGANGGFLRAFGGAAAGDQRRLLGVAADRDENLYVVDTAGGAVLAYTAEGGGGRRIEMPRTVRQWPPGLVDCAVGADGRLFLVDNTNNQIALIGRGGMGTVFGQGGSRAGEFSAPTFAATDEGGNFYVSDALNARVQVFSSSGEFLRAFGAFHRGPGGMGRPKGIAVRRGGEIFVADSWLNRVQVFDPSGFLLAVLADENGVPLDLGSPNGVALGPGNRIYIAERLTARLQIREIIDE